MQKGLQLKYATWNINILRCKEEEVNKTQIENYNSLVVIKETKMKVKGMNYTKNYIVFYTGVNRNIRAQSGVMIWIIKKFQ